jgi:large subunit ribosomal protein L20
MARVKRGIVSKRKHNKLAELTKGYRGTKHRLIKAATEAKLHAGAYAYHGRKLKKRDIRSLWIVRISEAAKKEGTSYSKLMSGLKKANVEIDRKILSDLVLNDPTTFTEIVKHSKAN